MQVVDQLVGVAAEVRIAQSALNVSFCQQLKTETPRQISNAAWRKRASFVSIMTHLRQR